MPDWTSPLEVARDADIFIKLMHALFGIYVYVLSPSFLKVSQVLSRWEWFISFDFDWQFITLQKTFKWPMVSSTLPSLVVQTF
jgi:hypothetical protein